MECLLFKMQKEIRKGELTFQMIYVNHFKSI